LKISSFFLRISSFLKISSFFFLRIMNFFFRINHFKYFIFRVAPHEYECRQYKHCTLEVPRICKKGEDCEAMRIRWWQTCWTSPCTSRCWYKGSVGNHEACKECCDLACRNDPKFVGNSCFRCTLCKSRFGPHSWGKLNPEAKFHGHVCWGKDSK